MNKILVVFTLILSACNLLKAQSNLVLNPDLEQHYDTTDNGIFGFDRNYVTSWSDPNHGSSDYFTPHNNGDYTTPPANVFGFEYPHSGLSYGGFGFYTGPTSLAYEYVQASFSSPLQAGRTYSIESYVSFGLEGYSLCISDLGFYFSDTQVSIDMGGDLINVIPQYENPSSNMINTHYGWQRITGNYTAHGGEKFMNIGLFKPYALAHVDTCDFYDGPYSISYLFIDDVAVYDTAKVDTIHLCLNDSVQIGGVWRHNAGLFTDIIGGLPVRFYIQPRPYSTNLTIIDKPFLPGDSVRISLLQTYGNDSNSVVQNFIWVSKDTTINIPMFNIYGCDSTVRYRCGTNIGLANFIDKELKWNIYPNPANDFIQVKLSTNNPTNYSVTLIDVAGSKVLTHSLVNDKIDISVLNSGMYFVRLINSKTGKVQGTIKFVKE